MTMKNDFTPSLSMLAWGFNEEELVEPFLDRAFELLEGITADYELIFVNDGSTDKTEDIVNAYQSKNPHLKVIHNKKNLNVGKSCSKAIKAASKDYIFWQTVDWSYDLSDINIFLSLLQHFDVVQGVRPTPVRLITHIPVIRSIYRVKTRSDNLYKAIISLSNYYLLRILFGVPFEDFQNITFYPRKLIQSVTLKGNSSFINPECLIKTFLCGARFIEVPIRFLPREAGEAKGARLTSIIRSIVDITCHWMDWGWQNSFKDPNQSKSGEIRRVSQPFELKDEELEIVLPLFKKYR